MLIHDVHLVETLGAVVTVVVGGAVVAVLRGKHRVLKIWIAVFKKLCDDRSPPRQRSRKSWRCGRLWKRLQFQHGCP